MILTLQSAFGWTQAEADYVSKLADIFSASGITLSALADKVQEQETDLTVVNNWIKVLLNDLIDNVLQEIDNSSYLDEIKDIAKNAITKDNIVVNGAESYTGTILDTILNSSARLNISFQNIAITVLDKIEEANTYLKDALCNSNDSSDDTSDES